MNDIHLKNHSIMQKKNQFDVDVTLNGGYLYSEKAMLSSTMANERLTQATLDTVVLRNKRVLDVGCGDGLYTSAIHQQLKPKETIGIDISEEAIKAAKKKYAHIGHLNFLYKNIYELNKKNLSIDCAIVRGVIHHVPDPLKAIKSVSECAPEILILEPNGYNPLLKVIEKISPYHRLHEEKSYFPFQIRRWLRECGYTTIIDEYYINIVPFFFPDMGAKVLKSVESVIESLPIVSRLVCGVYVVHAKK